MKLLFIPFSIVAGLIGAMIGRKLFDQVWGLIDEEEPPESEHQDVPWVKLILAAAIQGAIFRATKEAVDRATRQGFANVTGTWPGEQRPEQE